MTAIQSVSSIVNGPFRSRENRYQTVTKALVVHRETELAIKCSIDGKEPTGRDGWLPKRSIIQHPGSEQPFIVVSAPSWLLVEKMLVGDAWRLCPETLWTEENKLAWAWAEAMAMRLRKDAREKATRRSAGMRNHYA